jgi:hypothetical protein
MSSNGLMINPNIFQEDVFAKMAITFEYKDEIYSYVIHRFDPTFNQRNSQSGVAMNARQRPNVLTDDWLSEELFRGMLRDLQTPYARDQSFKEALEDAVTMLDGDCLFFFDHNDYLVGKINFLIDNVTRTINIMGLYAPSGRHRIKGVSYASLVWHIVASIAMTTFGESARVLMPYPRNTIYQRLLSMPCIMVHVITENNNLLASWATMIKYKRNNMMIRDIMRRVVAGTYTRDESDDESDSINDIIADFFEARGALFVARDLIDN